LQNDPVEIKNLFGLGSPETSAKQQELMGEMLDWMMRAQDPLPFPRTRYILKQDSKNYWHGKAKPR